MPNWCFNETVFYGDENETKKIYEELQQKVELTKIPTIDHIDNLLLLFGVTQEELDKEYWIRAHIIDFRLNDDNSLLVQYESAWNPIVEHLDSILANYKPNLKQVTLADECGMGIYVNTDTDGLYFTEKYWLDMSNEDGDDYNDKKYHDSLESAIDEFKKFLNLNININSLEEFQEIISHYEDEGYFITFQEFTPY